VIRSGDEDKVFWGGGCSDNLFEVAPWSEPVTVAAQEELGETASGEEGISELMTETVRGKS